MIPRFFNQGSYLTAILEELRVNVTNVAAIGLELWLQRHKKSVFNCLKVFHFVGFQFSLSLKGWRCYNAI